MSRQICIALHDVAPETWPQCELLLAMLDDLGRPPVTLLAVPNYHERGHLLAAPDVVRAIRRRVDQGDEVALHGYFHRDDAAPPRTPRAWLRRRLLTASEGEFSELSSSDAARRICRGWQEINDAFRPVHGFVAPAWLHSVDTWTALRDSPLRYASTRDALVVLDGMRKVPAPAITISARSRWRRTVSRGWLRLLCRTTASLPLVRVALHPVDAEHADVVNDWRRALGALLEARAALTKSRALELA